MPMEGSVAWQSHLEGSNCRWRVALAGGGRLCKIHKRNCKCYWIVFIDTLGLDCLGTIGSCDYSSGELPKFFGLDISQIPESVNH